MSVMRVNRGLRLLSHDDLPDSFDRWSTSVRHMFAMSQLNPDLFMSFQTETGTQQPLPAYVTKAEVEKLFSLIGETFGFHLAAWLSKSLLAEDPSEVSLNEADSALNSKSRMFDVSSAKPLLNELISFSSLVLNRDDSFMRPQKRSQKDHLNEEPRQLKTSCLEMSQTSPSGPALLSLSSATPSVRRLDFGSNENTSNNNPMSFLSSTSNSSSAVDWSLPLPLYRALVRLLLHDSRLWVSVAQRMGPNSRLSGASCRQIFVAVLARAKAVEDKQVGVPAILCQIFPANRLLETLEEALEKLMANGSQPNTAINKKHSAASDCDDSDEEVSDNGDNAHDDDVKDNEFDENLAWYLEEHAESLKTTIKMLREHRMAFKSCDRKLPSSADHGALLRALLVSFSLLMSDATLPQHMHMSPFRRSFGKEVASAACPFQFDLSGVVKSAFSVVKNSNNDKLLKNLSAAVVTGPQGQPLLRLRPEGNVTQPMNSNNNNNGHSRVLKDKHISDNNNNNNNNNNSNIVSKEANFTSTQGKRTSIVPPSSKSTNTHTKMTNTSQSKRASVASTDVPSTPMLGGRSKRLSVASAIAEENEVEEEHNFTLVDETYHTHQQQFLREEEEEEEYHGVISGLRAPCRADLKPFGHRQASAQSRPQPDHVLQGRDVILPAKVVKMDCGVQCDTFELDNCPLGKLLDKCQHLNMDCFNVDSILKHAGVAPASRRNVMHDKWDKLVSDAPHIALCAGSQWTKTSLKSSVVNGEKHRVGGHQVHSANVSVQVNSAVVPGFSVPTICHFGFPAQELLPPLPSLCVQVRWEQVESPLGESFQGLWASQVDSLLGSFESSCFVSAHSVLVHPKTQHLAKEYIQLRKKLIASEVKLAVQLQLAIQQRQECDWDADRSLEKSLYQTALSVREDQRQWKVRLVTLGIALEEELAVNCRLCVSFDALVKRSDVEVLIHTLKLLHQMEPTFFNFDINGIFVNLHQTINSTSHADSSLNNNNNTASQIPISNTAKYAKALFQAAMASEKL